VRQLILMVRLLTFSAPPGRWRPQT